MSRPKRSRNWAEHLRTIDRALKQVMKVKGSAGTAQDHNQNRPALVRPTGRSPKPPDR